jgi:hypothetical protein
LATKSRRPWITDDENRLDHLLDPVVTPDVMYLGGGGVAARDARLPHSAVASERRSASRRFEAEERFGAEIDMGVSRLCVGKGGGSLQEPEPPLLLHEA